MRSGYEHICCVHHVIYWYYICTWLPLWYWSSFQDTGWPISWRTWVGLTWVLTVPQSARFCLDWWEFGRSGWAARQDDGTSQIKVNPTQVRQEMGHPVLLMKFNFVIIIHVENNQIWNESLSLFCQRSQQTDVTTMQLGHIHTCAKYSSAILNAHSLQILSGRAGLETSAHLINILFRMATFSGVFGGPSES